jgi:hypothetical protein
MNLHPDELAEIEELATKGMNASDIALILKLEEFQFKQQVEDHTHPISIAYRRGRAITLMEINAKEVEYAKKGSPQASKLYYEKILPRQ